jgi:hypothetical protein
VDRRLKCSTADAPRTSKHWFLTAAWPCRYLAATIRPYIRRMLPRHVSSFDTVRFVCFGMFPSSVSLNFQTLFSFDTVRIELRPGSASPPRGRRFEPLPGRRVAPTRREGGESIHSPLLQV